MKNSSLEAVIYGAVRNLIPYHTHVIDNKTTVEEVKRLTGGEDIEGQQAFYCTDIGHISHRRIFGICEDKLKAKRTSKGRDIDKKRALEFLEEALKKKDVEYDLPKEIEILESDNERQDNDSEKVDSFDSILFSSGTQGTVGTLLEGVNESVTDNNLVDEKTKGTLQIQSSLQSENIEESTILLETSDNRDRHLPGKPKHLRPAKRYIYYGWHVGNKEEQEKPLRFVASKESAETIQKSIRQTHIFDIGKENENKYSIWPYYCEEQEEPTEEEQEGALAEQAQQDYEASSGQ